KRLLVRSSVLPCDIHIAASVQNQIRHKRAELVFRNVYRRSERLPSIGRFDDLDVGLIQIDAVYGSAIPVAFRRGDVDIVVFVYGDIREESEGSGSRNDIRRSERLTVPSRRQTDRRGAGISIDDIGRPL